MAYAPASHTYDETLLGEFKVADTDASFEYVVNTGWLADKYPHAIYCIDGSTRSCKVVKTRAYVVVDEDENGPVVETWVIKGHKTWRTV